MRNGHSTRGTFLSHSIYRFALTSEYVMYIMVIKCLKCMCAPKGCRMRNEPDVRTAHDSSQCC